MCYEALVEARRRLQLRTYIGWSELSTRRICGLFLTCKRSSKLWATICFISEQLSTKRQILSRPNDGSARYLRWKISTLNSWVREKYRLLYHLFNFKMSNSSSDSSIRNKCLKISLHTPSAISCISSGSSTLKMSNPIGPSRRENTFYRVYILWELWWWYREIWTIQY